MGVSSLFDSRFRKLVRELRTANGANVTVNLRGWRRSRWSVSSAPRLTTATPTPVKAAMQAASDSTALMLRRSRRP